MAFLYSLFYIAFALLFASWMKFELKKKVDLKKHWLWLLGPVITGLAGALVFTSSENVFTNFILHTSGGVSVTFIYIYLIKTFKIKLNWRLHLLALFALVSMLGVVNEIFEYAVELAHLGVMAWDIHDTWRDLVANTVGAFSMWFLYCLVRAFFSKNKH